MYNKTYKKRWGGPTVNKKYKRRRVIPKTIKENIVSFKRQFLLGTASVTVTSGWTAFPYSFRLDTMPNYSEIQSVFDSYRINAVKLTFMPYWDGNDYATQSATNFTVLPRVYTLIDGNGIPAGTINTEDKFLEYSNSKIITKPQEPFTIYFKPDIEVQAGGAAASGMSAGGPQWIDTSRVDVSHNGCALGMILPTGLTGGQTWAYQIVCTYYLSAKSVV